MAFRLPFRMLRACWKGVKTPSLATGRAVASVFRVGWPGLTLGSLAATLGLFGYMGAHLRTGLWRPLDTLGALVLAAGGLGATALVLLLLRLVFHRWPRHFIFWGLGSFLFGLITVAGMGGPTFMGVAMVGTLAALAGSLGLGLWVGWKRRTWGFRSAAVVLVGLSMLGTWNLVTWLTSPGSDRYLEAQVPANGPDIAPLSLPDPGQPGSHRVRTLTYARGNDLRRQEYGPGATLTTSPVDASPFIKSPSGFSGWVQKRYWGFDEKAHPLNARVWYPEGPGPFPLVLCVHGNHTAQDFSDPGYAYLGEFLASRGFIFASVDENFLNGSWVGGFRKENAVRGWLLLKHLETWRQWNQQSGHLFQGKVDLDRIALIGHSRGGEAVAIAAAYNRLTRWPEDATQRFDFQFGIRSVVAIAPIDGQYETSDVPTPLRDIDYLVLQGSHDADVCFFAGQRTFKRVAFTDGRPHQKVAIHIHRANHGQFNTVWGAYDHGEPTRHFLAPSALIPGEDQRQIARVFIGAALEASLHGKRDHVAFLRDPRRGASWLPKVILAHQFEDETFTPLATFDEDIDPCSASLPGGTLSGEDLTVWKERQIKGRSNFSFRHKGVWLGWDRKARPESNPSYTLELSPGAVNGLENLVLTLADSDDDPKPNDKDSAEDEPGIKPKPAPQESDPRPKPDPKKPKEPVDFTLELTDKEGRRAALPLSAFRPLQPVVKVQMTKWEAMENEFYGSAWEPVFQTFELPLERFAQAMPGWDRKNLRSLRLRFDRAPRGMVILDQIGLSRAPQP